jgi:hypothetical protein
MPWQTSIVARGTQPPVTSDGDAKRAASSAASLSRSAGPPRPPGLTAIVVRRAPRGRNTWAITEQAVALLRSAGFDDGGAARGRHQWFDL